eukprot:scaffold463_cov351-Prasinococcus_capsulatus_cf.AAC.9
MLVKVPVEVARGVTASRPASEAPEHRETERAPAPTLYNRRPRRPPFLRVLSVGVGVTSSARPQRTPPISPRTECDITLTAAARNDRRGEHYSDCCLQGSQSLQAATTGALVVEQSLTDAADLHARTRERAQGGLRSRARSLGAVAASGAKLDV